MLITRLAPALCVAAIAFSDQVLTDALLFDFEDGTLQGWTVLDECATDSPSFGGSPQVVGSAYAPDNSNHGGTKLVRSQNTDDTTTGIMESPHFKMCPGTTITLKIGGGGDNSPVDPENLVCGAGSTNVQLEYLDSGQWVRQEAVAQHGVMLHAKAFATPSIGDACVTARLRAYDLNTGGWGHVTVDDIKIDPYVPVGNPTPGPTGNPTPGPTGNPTPGPTGNPTPGPTGNPTPAPTPGPTSQADGLKDSIKILTELVTKNSEDLSKVSKELSEVKGLLNQHILGPSCYGRRAQA